MDARAAAELAMTLEVSGDLIGEGTAAGFPSIHSDFTFDWEVEDLRLSELLENKEGVGKGLTDAIK